MFDVDRGSASSRALADERPNRGRSVCRPARRPFVTGATGFIGRNLVERLSKDGANVICLVRDRASAISDPGFVLRRAAQSGHASRLLRLALGMLPEPVGTKMRERLFGPVYTSTRSHPLAERRPVVFFMSRARQSGQSAKSFRLRSPASTFPPAWRRARRI